MQNQTTFKKLSFSILAQTAFFHTNTAKKWCRFQDFLQKVLHIWCSVLILPKMEGILYGYHVEFYIEGASQLKHPFSISDPTKNYYK